MNVIGWLILAFISFVLFMQWKVLWKSKKMIGTSSPHQEENGYNSMLYYFYTPSCHACKAMTPVIDKLTTEHANIKKVDASTDFDLARKFNIMATPTTVLVKNHKIASFLVGAKREKDLLDLLNL